MIDICSGRLVPQPTRLLAWFVETTFIFQIPLHPLSRIHLLLTPILTHLPPFSSIKAQSYLNSSTRRNVTAHRSGAMNVAFCPNLAPNALNLRLRPISSAQPPKLAGGSLISTSSRDKRQTSAELPPILPPSFLVLLRLILDLRCFLGLTLLFKPEAH